VYDILYYMITQRNPGNPRYKIDATKKVFVYKNLHKDCWSVKQGGLVKAHATELNLSGCDFRVNRNGRLRVLREKRKNVHAGVRGYMGESTWDTYPEELFNEVAYNPYKYTSFVMKDTEAPRWYADQVRLKPSKVMVTPK
jgi:hypothetical protein